MSVRKALAIVALVPCLALGAEWNITPGHWSWKSGVDNVDALPGSGNLVNDVRVAGCVDAVGECSPTLWIWTSDEEWSQIVGDGGSAFADIASGTNTTAAMVVGSGSSISLTGTGTVEATSLLTPSAAAYVGGLGLDFRSTDLANSLGTLGFLSAGLLGTNAEEVRFDSNSNVKIRPKDTSGKSVDLLVSAANNTSSGAGGALILRGGTSVSGTAGITILQGCVQYGARSSAPSSPTPGECDTYYNTASDKLCTYNGSVWVCGGAPTFDEIDSGTNTTAAMVVGTGASLSATGSGTIAATTSTALAANGANCAAGQAAAGVDASGAAEGCSDVATQAELDAIDTSADDLSDNNLGDLANVTETGEGSGIPLVGDGSGGWQPAAAAALLSTAIGSTVQAYDADLTTLGAKTLSGNGGALVTTTGTQTSGDCVEIDANGNHVASGAACGGGGGLPMAVAGTYIAAGSRSAGAASSIAPANGSVYLMPWLIGRDVQIDRLAIFQTGTGAAGTTIEFVLYGSAADGSPGALMHITATPVASETTGLKEDSTVSETLVAGSLYWVGIVVRFPSGGPTYGAVGCFYGVALDLGLSCQLVKASYTSGADPWSWSASDLSNAALPGVRARVVP